MKADVRLRDDRLMLEGSHVHVQAPEGVLCTGSVTIRTKITLNERTPQAIRRAVGRLQLPGGQGSSSPQPEPSAVSGAVTAESLGVRLPQTASPSGRLLMDLTELGDVDDVAEAFDIPKGREVILDVDVSSLLLQLTDRVLELSRDVRQLQAKVNG